MGNVTLNAHLSAELPAAEDAGADEPLPTGRPMAGDDERLFRQRSVCSSGRQRRRAVSRRRRVGFRFRSGLGARLPEALRFREFFYNARHFIDI